MAIIDGRRKPTEGKKVSFKDMGITNKFLHRKPKKKYVQAVGNKKKDSTPNNPQYTDYGVKGTAKDKVKEWVSDEEMYENEKKNK